ncbi:MULTISPECIES: type VI secretion system protein TssA [Moraxella]|uniref:ImpA N-terminal domain-containing protein n=1 Tax=Moraxella lacunata TaxID=477 RepID=A0A1B8PYZ0_MORLA|nr:MULTISPECIES: type VI secretion system protein TssA [Moraxella]MBE9578320.1 type VI secretion system protein TssA [Moraxella sp. K1664]MBE9588158.1 type VI secretion system protein TssA [Moraxella sp. K1630]MBE9590044.1 type VI secretion system protein TssA [Moraxella sp. K127]MBE9596293.1 type VI secretion system protein TssA [Moraxella sp. K2450]MDH9219092.1 type VI secretion system protein TssA [Moraxella lacunata]
MDDFLAPLHDEQVAGHNIEYDDDFLNLMSLLQDKPEQQYGDLVVEAGIKDWRAIYESCHQILLHKSKDLLVMSYFTQSGIVLNGLMGLKEGLFIIKGNLEKYWEDVFPKLVDEDGDYDPDFRVNALSLFFAPDGILKDLRNAPLVKNGLSGKFHTVKEIEAFLESYDESLYAGGIQRLVIDLSVASDDGHSPISQLKEAGVLISAIKALFEKYEISGLKFEPTEQLIQKILDLLSQSGESGLERQDVTPTKMTDIKTAESVMPVMNWASYSVNSREDVQLLLEKIHVYFEKHEPSHPAPLFIRRIQKLMNLNFYEIMKDISPESLDRLENLVGQPLSNDDEFN